MTNLPRGKRLLVLALAAVLAVAGGAGSALLGDCGPFTDVTPAFCAAVFEVYVLGITGGTSPTTYSPNDTVTRLQMAPFLKRAVDTTLQRAGRRAAIGQFWTPQNAAVLGQFPVGATPVALGSDGADVWVAESGPPSGVSRLRGGDGKLLDTWTGGNGPTGILVAMGKVFTLSSSASGALLQLDPTAPAGALTQVAPLPGGGATLAFDGARIWTANTSGSVSIVTPGGTIPWPVTSVSTGFNTPAGILFDGSSVWVTDQAASTLLKLNAAGGIVQTVSTGLAPQIPTFDGTNIWVPNFVGSVTVVRAATGAVVTTLTGNGLDQSARAAFDGQRVLVTNLSGNVSLWKAADLSPLGAFPVGAPASGVCSDGFSFWITIPSQNKVVRF